MPQFEFANFIPQVFWLAIFFAILYFGVVRMTVPRVGKVMAAREDQVNADLNSAERAKAEADRMQAEYDTGVARAHDDARQRVAEAQASAAQSLEAKLKASNAELDMQSDAAEATLNAARQRALGQIDAVAADAASDIVERLTGARPPADAATRAAREALL